MSLICLYDLLSCVYSVTSFKAKKIIQDEMPMGNAWVDFGMLSLAIQTQHNEEGPIYVEYEDMVELYGNTMVTMQVTVSNTVSGCSQCSRKFY